MKKLSLAKPIEQAVISRLMDNNLTEVRDQEVIKKLAATITERQISKHSGLVPSGFFSSGKRNTFIKNAKFHLKLLRSSSDYLRNAAESNANHSGRFLQRTYDQVRRLKDQVEGIVLAKSRGHNSVLKKEWSITASKQGEPFFDPVTETTIVDACDVSPWFPQPGNKKWIRSPLKMSTRVSPSHVSLSYNGVIDHKSSDTKLLAGERFELSWIGNSPWISIKYSFNKPVYITEVKLDSELSVYSQLNFIGKDKDGLFMIAAGSTRLTEEVLVMGHGIYHSLDKESSSEKLNELLLKSGFTQTLPVVKTGTLYNQLVLNGLSFYTQTFRDLGYFYADRVSQPFKCEADHEGSVSCYAKFGSKSIPVPINGGLSEYPVLRDNLLNLSMVPEAVFSKVLVSSIADINTTTIEVETLDAPTVSIGDSVVLYGLRSHPALGKWSVSDVDGDTVTLTSSREVDANYAYVPDNTKLFLYTSVDLDITIYEVNGSDTISVDYEISFDNQSSWVDKDTLSLRAILGYKNARPGEVWLRLSNPKPNASYSVIYALKKVQRYSRKLSYEYGYVIGFDKQNPADVVFVSRKRPGTDDKYPVTITSYTIWKE